jgi:hypothetical protein
VGQWIFDHRTGVRSAGVIAAIVLLLLVPAKTVATVIWLVIAVLIWLLAVALFGRPRPAAALAKADADAGDRDAGPGPTSGPVADAGSSQPA